MFILSQVPMPPPALLPTAVPFNAASLPHPGDPQLERRLAVLDANGVVNDDGPMGYPMGIGGLEWLRGVKPYGLLTPNATVASPYGVTQVHAARDAAGVNGVVRFPAAGSPYTLSSSYQMTVAGQTWQMETAAVSIGASGGISLQVKANGCTWEGGVLAGEVQLTRGGGGSNFTLRNTKRDGGNRGVLCEAVSGLYVKNCEIVNGTGAFGETYYDQNGDGDVTGQVWENCIAIQTAAAVIPLINNPGVSMITAHDGGGFGYHIYGFKVTNCRLDGGSGNQNNHRGWFGIEIWSGRTDGSGHGPVVEYCDIRGGQFATSIVQSTDKWIHHNIFWINQAGALADGGPTGIWGVAENAGTNNTGGIVESNTIIAGSDYGALIYHNNGASGLTVRNNKLSDVTDLVNGSSNPGGGYTVQDNCTINVTNIISGSGWGTANTVNNNSSTDGPCKT